MQRSITSIALAASALASVLASGCGSGVSSDEQARRAYVGLDVAIDKAINLGFDGFNAASSANIPAQITGTCTSGPGIYNIDVTR